MTDYSERLREAYILSMVGGAIIAAVGLSRTTLVTMGWTTSWFDWLGLFMHGSDSHSHFWDVGSLGSKEKMVTTEEGKEFMEYFIHKLGVPAVFRETSAKTGEHILDTFEELLRMMAEEMLEKRRTSSLAET